MIGMHQTGADAGKHTSKISLNAMKIADHVQAYGRNNRVTK